MKILTFLFKPKFRIEFYPETKKYMAMLGMKYLQKDYYTGIVQTTDWIDFADKFSTEGDARNLINLYKEQQFKENVKVINVE